MRGKEERPRVPSSLEIRKVGCHAVGSTDWEIWRVGEPGDGWVFSAGEDG